MERSRRVKPKIGYFGSSLAAYWPQFPALKPIVLEAMDRRIKKLQAMGCEVVNGGIVDRHEVSIEVGDMFARQQVDLIIGDILTYTASHVLVPIAQRNIAPYLTLALQTKPTLNYTGVGTLELTHFATIMEAPEVSCAFQRCGLPFNCVVGGEFQEETWRKVEQWVQAAAVKTALMRSRMGYLGHYYPGMLDIYTDFTLHQRWFGTHVEILEMCDLTKRVNEVSEEQIENKIQETKEMFLMPEPGYDPITEKVVPEDLRWAAQVACAEDKLIEDFSLDGLAYYYRGLNNNEYERVGAAMILGNSFATARGIPCAGEADLKTCIAMFIMEHFNAGGSFCEIYMLDFDGGFIVAGHDGPGHIGIGDKRPILRGMKLFHGKAGFGVSVEFSVKNGPITMFSITQTNYGRIKFIVAEGYSIPGPILQIGNTNTRVKFDNMTPVEFGQIWAETGSSHHFALAVGHQLGKIEKLAKLLNAELQIVTRCS